MTTDELLIKGCQKNDRNAQRELFEKYSSYMMGVCLRYCGNEEDAKDVLHDGYIKVFDSIGKFKGNSKLTTWMARIFINLSINRLRHGRLKHPHVEFDLSKEVRTQEPNTLDSNTSSSPEKVLGAVQNLPDIYRAIINMYAVDGMSHKEIANALNITVGTSKSRLSRAREMLKSTLNR